MMRRDLLLKIVEVNTLFFNFEKQVTLTEKKIALACITQSFLPKGKKSYPLVQQDMKVDGGLGYQHIISFSTRA